MPGSSKIKLESTWYVRFKCLTGTLEIKVASTGQLKCKLQVPGTWEIKLESTWYAGSIDM